MKAKRKPVNSKERKLLTEAIKQYKLALESLKKANNQVHNNTITWMEAKDVSGIKWNLEQAQSVLKSGWAG